jgi:hypothetical protein
MEGMEILLSVALGAGKIVADREYIGTGNFPADRVDYYIRCSMKNAFTKVSSCFNITIPWENLFQHL